MSSAAVVICTLKVDFVSAEDINVLMELQWFLQITCSAYFCLLFWLNATCSVLHFAETSAICFGIPPQSNLTYFY